MNKISIFLIVISLFFLHSCLPSVELNERAIVEAIGIDKIDGKFAVSIAYYAPNSINQESTQTEFVKESAADISSAISEISSKINKELYFGHNNFIVVGLKAAEGDILNIIQYFDAETQTKADICIFVAETAEKIINTEDKKLSYISILEIVEKTSKQTDTFEYKLFKILDRSNSKSRFVLPFGTITDDLYFEVVGICAFVDGILKK